MIYINNKINHPTLQQSALLFMRHYRDDEFLALVRNVKQFNHTQDTGEQVAKKLESAVLDIAIEGYRTWNRWSNVIGHMKNNVIYVNTRKIDLPLNDRVENICHEIFHAVGYSHRGNYVNAYNLRSVPYLGASIFAKYVMSKQ